jgi:hypothetical protein
VADSGSEDADEISDDPSFAHGSEESPLASVTAPLHSGGWSKPEEASGSATSGPEPGPGAKPDGEA